jgi:hypothetical protein
MTFKEWVVVHRVVGTPIAPITPVPPTAGELIDYMTSMITDEDPMRGLLFY